MADAREMEKAIEVFVRAFALTRSFTHPYLPQRVGKLWVVRDGPRKNAKDYRREEWMAHGVEPGGVDAVVRERRRGRFCICAIVDEGGDQKGMREEYKALGYRLGSTEAMMVHRMGKISKALASYPVKHVKTKELADRVAKAARHTQALEEHLKEDSRLRLYAAMDGDKPVGWVRSVAVEDAIWVAGVFVSPQYRRRGIGKAMLVKMLRDVQERGARLTFLSASHAGAMLYPLVGFEKMGEVLVYTPRRR